MVRTVLVSLLCLLIAAALWRVDPGPPEGLSIPDDMGARPLASEAGSVGPMRARASGSPWAEGYQLYRNEQYLPLVANAYAAPERASLALALSALYDCGNVLAPKAHQMYLDRIEAGPEDLRPARRRAHEALLAPCRGLGTYEEIAARREAISAQLVAAGDAQNGFLESLRRTMESPDRAVRQARIEEIIALDDPYSTGMAVGYLTGKGATFEGVELSFLDRIAYMAAWSHVRCINHAECGGPDTRQGRFACMYHGECGGFDMVAFFEILFPGFVAHRIQPYYRRIQSHLDRGRYGMFGVP